MQKQYTLHATETVPHLWYPFDRPSITTLARAFGGVIASASEAIQLWFLLHTCPAHGGVHRDG